MQGLEGENTEILIIGADNPHDYVAFVEKISQISRNSSDPSKPKIVPKIIRELPQLVELFAEDLLPVLIFIDLSSFERHSVSAQNIQAYIRGIKALDPMASLWALDNEIPPREIQNKWREHFISGWMRKDFKVDDLEDSLKDAFLSRIQMTPRRLRIKSDHAVEVRISNLDQARAAEVLDLGMGGLFIQTSTQSIRPGDKIDFQVLVLDKLSHNLTGTDKTSNPLDEFDDKAPESFSGTALVVWVREKGSQKGPEGVGIQFLSVDSKTHQFFKSEIMKRKTTLFLPER